MDILNNLLQRLERSSPGSAESSRRVVSMIKGGGKALYFGDECMTPSLLAQAGCEVTALITEESRIPHGGDVTYITAKGFEPAQLGQYDVIWYNGFAEFDLPQVRLEQLKGACKKGGTVVYRTLCWLIDPSPDTRSYCKKRFGVITPLDSVLVTAKQAGFKIEDFYIAPKTDWTEGFYAPLSAAVQEYADSRESDSSLASGMGELERETSMFALHCEEYSCVYYILKG